MSMRRMSGRRDSLDRVSWWQAPIRVSVGHIMHLNLTIAAGMDRWPTMTTIGMTPSIPAVASAVLTLLSLAMTTSTEVTPLEQRLATMEAPIKLEWRRAHSGLAAATWTRVLVPRPGTLSAWTSSLPRLQLAVERAIRQRRR